MSPEIEKAYRYCQSVTKKHAKSFYFAAKFLPPSKQKPIYALYALCRHVDDEVDEAEVQNENEAVAAVERWKIKLDKIYKGEGAIENQNPKIKIRKSDSENRNSKTGEQNSVLLAWSDLLENYKIPRDLPLELMKGVLQDTHTKRYETFAELYVYCFRVASTVGLMSSEIFGYQKPETLEYAEALGIAMQLTNILRDVKEDALMKRIYLPQEDLRKFNVSEEQIIDGQTNENFARLMSFQIARARSYYERAELGIPLLEKDTRFTVLLAARLYSKILDEIEKQNYDVFRRRAHINFRRKLFSIPGIWKQARSL